jgi:hypothetical protein
LPLFGALLSSRELSHIAVINPTKRHRFGHVLRTETIVTCKISDRAGHTKNAVTGTRGKSEPGSRVIQYTKGRRICFASRYQITDGQARVQGAAPCLNRPRRPHPSGDESAGLPIDAPIQKFGCCRSADLDVQIQPIHKRPG